MRDMDLYEVKEFAYIGLYKTSHGVIGLGRNWDSGAIAFSIRDFHQLNWTFYKPVRYILPREFVL